MTRAAAVVAVVLALALAGCGDDTGSASLTVGAASSLTKAFTDYGASFSSAHVRLSFAGSDELAAQIRQGVKPDVFAAANPTVLTALYTEGLLERPVGFARSRLVIAVPTGDHAIESIDDLANPGVKLAIGAKSVPVGQYTRKVLTRLEPDRRKAILANVRSNEPNVNGIVGKLTQGAVDGGFVYITDVKAARGRLRAIELPANLQPLVTYAVAVVKGTKNPGAAKQFVDGLLNGDGARLLRDAGFGAP